LAARRTLYWCCSDHDHRKETLMEIGKEKPARIVTPIENPVPERVPQRAPARRTAPTRTPAPTPAPTKVPVRT
jgi:hypothetical protein